MKWKVKCFALSSLRSLLSFCISIYVVYLPFSLSLNTAAFKGGDQGQSMDHLSDHQMTSGHVAKPLVQLERRLKRKTLNTRAKLLATELVTRREGEREAERRMRKGCNLGR